MKRYGCVTALACIGGLILAVSCSSDDDDVQFGSSGGSDGVGTGGQGGGGGDGVSNGELVLVSQTPAPNDENAWSLAPLELTFSQPLDEDTLDGAIRIQVDGANVARSVSLD